MLSALVEKVLGTKAPAIVPEEPKAVIQPNPFILDLVTPSVLSDDDPDKKTLAVGGTVRTVFRLKDSVETVDPDWFSFAYDRPGSVQTFVMVPSDMERLRRSLDHSDARQGVVMGQGGSASSMERAERTRASNRTMLRIMGDYNEPAFDCAVLHQNICDGREALAEENKALMGMSGSLVMEPCVLEQMRAFWAASPFWVDCEAFVADYGKDIFASTIAAAVPFSDNSVDDGVGSYLGTGPTGTICRLDMSHTKPGRDNNNIFLSGTSGSGKTSAIDVIVSQDLAQGSKVLIVDAERTFRKGCLRAHGQWIDMGHGAYVNKRGRITGAWLSPLEPRLAISDTEDDGGGDDLTVLRSTITYLHGWAAIMWGLTKEQMHFLDDGLRAAYARYGIDYSTMYEDIGKDEYPTFDDLADCFDALEAAEERDEDRRTYHLLAKAARDCGVDGTHGNLFGRRSNVDVTSDFVVFDVYGLSDAEDSVRAAQLYSVASWVWSMVARSRRSGQFVRVVYDEVHLFYNIGDGTGEDTLAPARFLNSCQKRIRKYNGGLITATQNISDILDKSVRRLGEALITSSTYKFFFHTDGSDLDNLKETMKLTDHVAELIDTGFEQGDCLMCAGATRSRMHFELTDYVSDFWTGA